MRRSKDIYLLQIEPKVVWDTTERVMLRTVREDQRHTLDKLLDCLVTVHIATKYNEALVAQRIACAEVQQRPNGRWRV